MLLTNIFYIQCTMLPHCVLILIKTILHFQTIDITHCALRVFFLKHWPLFEKKNIEHNQSKSLRLSSMTDNNFKGS